MLPTPARVERASSARTWLASVSLPAPIRSSLANLIDATAEDEGQIATVLPGAIASVDSFLDAASRLELQRLTELFRS
jgi:hypothetical protein